MKQRKLNVKVKHFKEIKFRISMTSQICLRECEMTILVSKVL